MATPLEAHISVSHFKATCLAVLERVNRTGRSVVITKRGTPIAELVPPSSAVTGTGWVGSLHGTARIADDLVSPAGTTDDWDALRS